jgi:hypothetical protein
LGKDGQGEVKTIQKLLRYLEIMLPSIAALINHVEKGVDDEEEERQLALNLIRSAKDAKAREEILNR